MHTLFARLRALSLTAQPTPPEPEPRTSQSAPLYTPPINRHIHPDPNALLATYDDEHARNEPDRGLRPSSRRQSVEGPFIRRSDAHISSLEPRIDEMNEPTRTREPSPTTVPVGIDETTSQPHWLIHSFTHFASPSVWSTFGRGRHPSSSPADPFSHHDSRPGSPNKLLLATPDSLERRPSSRKSSIKPHSSHSHDSAGSESKRSSTNQSIITTSTPARSRSESTRTHIAITAFATQDSPRTFGYPTPEIPPSGSGYAPPPLPTLIHHGLHTIESQDGDEDREEEAIEAVHRIPLTIRRDTGALHPKDQSTYPRRSRIPNDPTVISRSRSLSTPAPTSSLSTFQQIFTNPEQQPQNNAVLPVTPDAQVDVPRTTTVPRPLSISGRRSSAEWSAEQAVSVDANTWPAQVSRQILELSLGTGNLSGEPQNSRLPWSESRDRDSSARTPSLTFASSPPLTSSPPLLSLSPSLGPPFYLQDPRTNLSDQSTIRPSGSPATRKQAKKAAAGGKSHAQLDATTMTGQSKNVRTSTTPSRRSSTKATRVTRSADGPLPSSAMPFQSFSAASSPESGSGSGSRPGTTASAPPAPNRYPRRSVSDPEPLKRRSALGTPVKPAGSSSGDSVEGTPSTSISKGKRKADDVESTPPDQKRENQRATFALPADPRPSRASNSASSHSPPSYHRKRARLSTSTPPIASPPGSRSASSLHDGSAHIRGHTRGSSRTAIEKESRLHQSQGLQPRPSLSQVSIPISALVSPHAPSLSVSGTFHMRDPRKPRRVQPTGWALRWGEAGEPGSGSPVQAWMFFFGWVLFPMWWLASVWSIPKTRRVGGAGDMEKAVTLDDPQVEHDATSWRFRCRVMAAVSLVTYIPFIVLIVIFVRRSR